MFPSRGRARLGGGVIRISAALLAGGLLAGCQGEPPRASNADSTRVVIAQMEGRLREGMVRADTALLASLWAPEYLSTSAVGHTSTRAEALMAFGAGMVRLDSVAIRDLDIRPYDATAVSLGYMDWAGQAAGSPFASTVRFQHVWVHNGGAWRLVASQLTNQPASATRPGSGR